MFFGILYVSYEFVWAYNVLSLGIETGLLGGCCIKDLSINSSLIKQMYPSAAHLILHLLSSICLWTCGVVSSYISLFRPMFNINLIFNLLIYIYIHHIFNITYIQLISQLHQKFLDVSKSSVLFCLGSAGAFGQLQMPEFILLLGSNRHGRDLSLRSCNSARAEIFYDFLDDGEPLLPFARMVVSLLPIPKYILISYNTASTSSFMNWRCSIRLCSSF